MQTPKEFSGSFAAKYPVIGSSAPVGRASRFGQPLIGCFLAPLFLALTVTAVCGLQLWPDFLHGRQERLDRLQHGYALLLTNIWLCRLPVKAIKVLSDGLMADWFTDEYPIGGLLTDILTTVQWADGTSGLFPVQSKHTHYGILSYPRNVHICEVNELDEGWADNWLVYR